MSLKYSRVLSIDIRFSANSKEFRNRGRNGHGKYKFLEIKEIKNRDNDEGRRTYCRTIVTIRQRFFLFLSHEDAGRD